MGGDDSCPGQGGGLVARSLGVRAGVCGGAVWPGEGGRGAGGDLSRSKRQGTGTGVHLGGDRKLWAHNICFSWYGVFFS